MADASPRGRESRPSEVHPCAQTTESLAGREAFAIAHLAACRSRRLFDTTVTLLKAIVALAIIGLSSQPVSG